ncbi:L,D-transpeptidase family protein [Austwickia chelonae]|uniref:L,D-transpeptidase family protein n=1 Tax=Austwickia chelonae TaxID=100225 RepID=UPI0013C331F7|nr:L,D-transpeptidase family protein [Austwickia chelonae]
MTLLVRPHRRVRRSRGVLPFLSALLALFAVGLPAQARVGGDERPDPATAYSSEHKRTLDGLGSSLPVPYSGAARQLVVVRADCRACTSATLQAWEVIGPGRGVPVTPPVRAKIGERGVGAAYENSRLTPLGTYDLTGAFGRQSDPGTRMPYFVAGLHDYWDDDSGSPTYNQHVYSPQRPAGESLGGAGAVYDYAVVMGVNPARRPYGGSGFFLHVTDGRPTLGCVAIDAPTLVRILRWLAPASRPQIVVTL